MKNQKINTNPRIKSTNSRYYATRNTDSNAAYIFTENDFRMQFDSNEAGISYLKNKTFKSNPIWETLEDRFIATTENYYYVLLFIGVE